MEGGNPSPLSTGEAIPGTLSSSHQDRHEATGDSPAKGHKGGEECVFKERLRDLGLFSLEKIGGNESVYTTNTWRKQVKKTDRLCLVMPLAKSWGHGCKQKHSRCFSEYQETLFFFFNLKMAEHWNKLPRDVVKSSSLEILRNCLAKVLGKQF